MYLHLENITKRGTRKSCTDHSSANETGQGSPPTTMVLMFGNSDRFGKYFCAPVGVLMTTSTRLRQLFQISRSPPLREGPRRFKVPPFINVPRISQAHRSKLSISTQATLVPTVMPSLPGSLSNVLQRFMWLQSTPFGFPVVPDLRILF